ncbi:hypothetical protein [Alces alces faeces associated microvirus MP10 5560]|uniref:hypothetical protein n=1 Tax=Alces alces faeces associated microvirus MP10 5560 TaxID=2219133 RepID=UPI000DF0359F|nr:hypothetical protein [Alces alces faeces associated microvirus MP10 5560]AXB22561.1 hypothetical protein [Alces alces faeces associated microvirus MP10 5560]
MKIIKSGIIKIIFKAFLAFLEVLIDLLQEEAGNGEEAENSEEAGNGEETETDTQNKIEKFIFPMEYLRITQDENSAPSHIDSYAIDFGGKDGEQDILYAPCEMICKRIRENANGEQYWESTKPVLFADGTTDYAHMLFIHDNNTFNNEVGDIIQQGNAFYKEGGMYQGNPTHYANHVHIEAGKGKWNNCMQFQNDKGTWVSENIYTLSSLFWLHKNTKILDAKNHKFKFEN